jgi:hypothetical protein
MAHHKFNFFIKFLLITEKLKFKISIDFHLVIIRFRSNCLKTYSNYQKKNPNFVQLTPLKLTPLKTLVAKFLKHFLMDFFCFQQY